MADIKVSEIGTKRYEVTVTEGNTSTTHDVTVDRNDVEGVSGADLVEASFRFLLDREPKEAILGEFELSVISRYFPEYRDEIGSYL